MSRWLFVWALAAIVMVGGIAGIVRVPTQSQEAPGFDLSVAPAITVSPTSGAFGSTYTVTGSGFTASSPATVSFSALGDVQPPVACSDGTYSGTTITTDGSGDFVCTFNVLNDETGTYTIIGLDEATGDEASADFTLVPSIQVDPVQGAVGSSAVVEGTGFTYGGSVSIVLGDTEVAVCTGNAVSDIDCQFTVPNLSSGQYSLSAVDETSGAVAETPFTVLGPAITVSPSSGAFGSTYTVTGSGFTASSPATVSFSALGDVQPPVACSDGTYSATTITTDGSGDFVCTFNVLNEEAGSYTITGLDETTGDEPTTDFTLVPSIQVEPGEGAVGSSAVVDGTGFTYGGNVRIALSDTEVAVCVANAVGDIDCQFTVPNLSSGPYPLSADDESSGAEAVTSFTVLASPAIMVSPSSGTFGSTYTVTGSGFTAGKIAYVAFGTPESVQVPVACSDGAYTGGAITTDTDGAFVCTYTTPDVSEGSYSIIGVDEWTNLEDSVSFAVTPLITLSTQSGPIGSTYIVMGYGFTAEKIAYIAFGTLESVEIPAACSDGTYSGGAITTDAYGSFVCTYNTPDVPGGSYWIIGADESTNLEYSVRFTVIPSISVDPTSGTVGSTYSVAGSGFTASALAYVAFDSAVSVQTPVACSDGTYSGEAITTDAVGDFVCSFITPEVSGGSHLIIGADETTNLQASAPFTVFALSISVAPTSAPIGSPYVVVGSGFTPGGLAKVSFGSLDSVQAPTACSDGTFSGTSITTDGSGIFACTFTTPDVTDGSYLITAVDESTSLQASTSFTVPPPAISISPTSGPVGSTYVVWGSGFTPSDQVTVDFAAGPALPSGCTDGTNEGGAIITDASGDFGCSFTVPSEPGGTYSVTAEDLATLTETQPASFSVGPSITFSPDMGPVGSTYVVTGSGFTASSHAYVTFAGVAQVPTACTDGTNLGGMFETDASGDFSCSFTVPSESGGTYGIWGYDVATGSIANGGDFEMLPSITVSPHYGLVGSTYVVVGTGFLSESPATVSFDGSAQAPIGCTQGTDRSGQIDATVKGDFRCSFAVPNEPGGTYPIIGQDLYLESSPVNFKVVGAAITIAPGQGPIGATVTVSGTNFAAASSVSLDFLGVVVPTCSSGSLTSSAQGAFACTFFVPSGVTGDTVVATDADSGQVASGSFTVTLPAVAVAPKQGPVGATVKITGTGFSVSSDLQGVLFGGVPIPSCLAGSFKTSSTGSFSCTVRVPSGTTSSAVQVVDAGGATAVAAFTVTTLAISITPGQGPIGAGVVVTGTGFSVSKAVTLNFDGAPILSCSRGSLLTSATGAFSCGISVPPGVEPNDDTVTVTDAGQSAIEGTFIVTTPQIVVTPGSGPAGSEVIVAGSGFSVLSKVQLLFDGVSITSCNSGTSLKTDDSGEFYCQFKVPSGTTTSLVIATDVGGATASTTFVVTESSGGSAEVVSAALASRVSTATIRPGPPVGW